MTSTAMALHAKTNPDAETWASLTGEGGPLQSGALPNVDITSQEGEKQLWTAMGENPVSKLKRREPKDPADPVEPKTTKEKLGFFFKIYPFGSEVSQL